jgi:hypothetical protein
MEIGRIIIAGLAALVIGLAGCSKKINYSTDADYLRANKYQIEIGPLEEENNLVLQGYFGEGAKPEVVLIKEFSKEDEHIRKSFRILTVDYLSNNPDQTPNYDQGYVIQKNWDKEMNHVFRENKVWLKGEKLQKAAKQVMDQLKARHQGVSEVGILEYEK